MRKTWILALAAIVLVACSQAAEPQGALEETFDPAAAAALSGQIIAEGTVEPVRWSELHYGPGGTVVEVLAQLGDTVAQDDVLVSFDATDARLAVQEAEAALAMAEAGLARTKTGARPEEIAVADAQVAAGDAVLAQAAAQRDQLNAGATDAQVAAAQAEFAAAQAQQLAADDAHDATMRCFEFKLSDGTKDKICPALGTYEELTRFQLQAADDALAAAQAQLDAAQGGSEAQLRAAQSAVGSAAAQRDAAQSAYDLLLAGATVEEIAAAEAQVAQAQAALAAAEATLDRTKIRAPFAGTVAQIEVDPGDTASPGALIAVVGTLDRLQVRTIDLTELDVARVAVGQSASVEPDGLPDVKLGGSVLRIDKQSVDYRGDVTYPVIIELQDTDPALRWGMTTLLRIQTD
jgi:HlyD family secretion protein